MLGDFVTCDTRKGAIFYGTLNPFKNVCIVNVISSEIEKKIYVVKI